MRSKTCIPIAALAAVVLLAGEWFVPPARAGSRWGADYFPNVTLTTHEGKTVRFYDDLLKDKIVAIDLIYTHCKDSCPLETARLAQLQKLLGDRVGKDIFFYSISIDPKADTPEILKAYAEKFHAGPGWLFLTGKKEDIDLIAKKLGLYSEPNPEDRDGHRPILLVGNVPAGQWMQNSAVDNPKFLAVTINNFLGNWQASVASNQTYDKAQPIQLKGSGHYLFNTRCIACHSVGQGDKVGPDLAGVTTVRDRAWLKRFIKTPEKVLEEKDPIATALFRKYKGIQMPNLRLGDEDVEALISYIESESAAFSAAAVPEHHHHESMTEAKKDTAAGHQ